MVTYVVLLSEKLSMKPFPLVVLNCLMLSKATTSTFVLGSKRWDRVCCFVGVGDPILSCWNYLFGCLFPFPPLSFLQSSVLKSSAPVVS